MYTNFYNLKEKPFSLNPNPDYLYKSNNHSSALTYLNYAITENIGFVLLTGEIGSGKTTLIRHLLDHLDLELEVAVIFNTNISAEELIKLILQEYETQPTESKAGNLDKLYNFLTKSYQSGKRALLIIDEAQNLSSDALEEVRMLSNLQTGDHYLLQIILVGQPELQKNIHKPNLTQLEQRIAVSYHLHALSKKETREYINYRLQKAGDIQSELFTQEAIDLIYAKTNGIPRKINSWCDTALVYGYADENKVIDKTVVEQVAQDKEAEQDVPENNPLDITDSSTEHAFYLSELYAKTSNLQNRLDKLEMMVNWQLQEVQEQREENKDLLIQELKSQLSEEKNRKDKILSKYSMYKSKINQLEAELNKHNFGQKKESKERSLPTNNMEKNLPSVPKNNILLLILIFALFLLTGYLIYLQLF